MQLIVTSSAGCKDTILDSVKVLKTPTAFFTADTVCEGLATHFLTTLRLLLITGHGVLETALIPVCQTRYIFILQQVLTLSYWWLPLLMAV